MIKKAKHLEKEMGIKEKIIAIVLVIAIMATSCFATKEVVQALGINCSVNLSNCTLSLSKSVYDADDYDSEINGVSVQKVMSYMTLTADGMVVPINTTDFKVCCDDCYGNFDSTFVRSQGVDVTNDYIKAGRSVTLYLKGKDATVYEGATNTVEVTVAEPVPALKVVYYNQSGVQYQSQMVTDTVTIANGPALKGYNFKGWSPLRDSLVATYTVGQTVTVTQDLSLFPVYELLPPYKVLWDCTKSGAGSGSTTSVSVDRKTASTVAPSGEAVAGYIFKGWSTTIGGAATVVAGQTVSVTGDCTYYGVYEKVVTPTPTPAVEDKDEDVTTNNFQLPNKQVTDKPFWDFVVNYCKLNCIGSNKPDGLKFTKKIYQQFEEDGLKRGGISYTETKKTDAINPQSFFIWLKKEFQKGGDKNYINEMLDDFEKLPDYYKGACVSDICYTQIVKAASSVGRKVEVVVATPTKNRSWVDFGSKRNSYVARFGRVCMFADSDECKRSFAPIEMIKVQYKDENGKLQDYKYRPVTIGFGSGDQFAKTGWAQTYLSFCYQRYVDGKWYTSDWCVLVDKGGKSKTVAKPSSVKVKKTKSTVKISFNAKKGYKYEIKVLNSSDKAVKTKKVKTVKKTGKKTVNIKATQAAYVKIRSIKGKKKSAWVKKTI